MSKSAEKLYLKRKLGEGMGIRYILSSFTPALLVFLIMIVLIFSITFIVSFSDAIDRMIVLLGSGSISSMEKPDQSIFPSGTTIDYVVQGEGILYTENGESLAFLKGIEDGYFDGEREVSLKLSRAEEESGNSIYISKSLARSLELSLGDRLTLLLYENQKNRTRPVLMTVNGIFDSGYAQLDKYLAYVPAELLDGAGGYEIVLPMGSNVEDSIDDMHMAGYDFGVYSYKELYSDLYLNVQQSIQVLYLILAAVAFLSAFFSSDIARVYISRDSSDIAALLMLGMSEKRIRAIYTKLTIVSVSVAAILGSIGGLCLSLFSPGLISFIASKDPTLLEYYITSFTINIPWLRILAVVVVMLLVSYVTLRISLRRVGKGELGSLVNNV